MRETIDLKSAASSASPSKKFWNRKRRENLAGWLFVTPEVIGMLLFSVFPLVFSLFLSFTKWNLVGGLSDIEFIGLDNFKALFTDSQFLKALRNNVMFTAIVVPGGLIISLIMAVLIQSRVFLRSYFKIAFFIPYICSTVAIAAIWSALFHPSKGPINQMLMQIGFMDPPKWLVDTTYAIFAIMIIYVWQIIGYKIIIFISGLAGISNELYESANIDGANGLKQFWYITIPLLGPTTFFLTITSIITSFKVFDIIKFLTDGGPNYASTVIVYQIYLEGFQRFNMGYASAMSLVLFLMIVLVTSLTWIFQSKKTHY
ncbi:ABC transporter permease [Paenibacillus antibioticophila]|uniref:ABC transporter permease n=1 Tax=Paenibacillus antibioticophila TaxID=1274374 RepID=A0A919XSN8_9BACL|nr:sugar ABC transporter permease [Paenibacillus antibioticophila]GIO37696.1 ABC transporter permease [Paenibacillus antibioticophila]